MMKSNLHQLHLKTKEGSKTNPKGSAEGDSDEEIEFSEQTEKSIQTIIDKHNDEIKKRIWLLGVD